MTYLYMWMRAVEVLGLFRDHVELFFRALGAERQELFVARYNEISHVDNIKLARWSERAYWSGDEWLLLFAVARFVFTKACDGDTVLKQHLSCFRKHLQYLGVLLQESLTMEEIDRAEQVCIDCRKDMVDLFGKDEMTFPNFHAILREQFFF